MKIVLVLVGKTVKEHLSKAIHDYFIRIKHYAPFDICVIPDLKNTKNLSEAQQNEREGTAILKLIEANDFVVLLDDKGLSFTSLEFASWVDSKQMQSSRRLVFIIGGAYGFSPEVYARANEMLSLSRMTFSHQLVRLIFLEQLYRAFTILRGEPYHHE